MKSSNDNTFYHLPGVCTFFVFLFTVFLFETSSSQSAHGDSLSSPPAVEIGGTQSLHFTSSIVGQEFDLYVNIPRDYQDTSKAFPVIYLLDGQWDFPLLNAIFGEQSYDGFIPGALVVGIAWGGKNPNYDMLRARDLTPSATKQAPTSGNAPKFLEFIKKELIPFVDARFRTKKDDRTLMGSSLGGLFTLYALFQETSLFNRYVLTSPAIGWDDGVIESYMKDYTPNKSQFPIKVFMAVGGLEGNERAFEKFADVLKAKKLEGLEIDNTRARRDRTFRRQGRRILPEGCSLFLQSPLLLLMRRCSINMWECTRLLLNSK